MFRRNRKTADRANPPDLAAFQPLATESDVLACFRLLFGRLPSAADWEACAPAIGGDLSALVALITDTAEFRRHGRLSRRHLAATVLEAAGARRADEAAAVEVATEDDIYYCFRLLLGRLPQAHEVLGHWALVGNPLAQVVAAYAGSHEFAQRALAAPSRAGQISLSQQDGFSVYVDEDDIAVGRHVATGGYEPDVTALFRRMLEPGMSVIDIGANIGYFAMLAASLVGPSGHVLAVEPNPRNARMLEASRKANGFANMTLCQAAAGEATGVLALHAVYSNGMTAAVSDDVDHLLAAETVACLRVDRLVEPGRKVDFIKIDVEGAEYTALIGCTRIIEADRPVIVSEFSPELIAGISGISGPGYLRWLAAFGYTIAVVAPDGSIQGMEGPDAVMQVYFDRGSDHIDVIALPG